jgi:glucose dehydrogenase
MGSKVHDVPLAKEMPPGDVRGFDVRTGKQLWQFRSIPGEGEFGNETWEQGSWKTTGAANVWTMMSADEALGYVYLPFSTPANDHFGGQRPGNGLFGESLVTLDARTGKRVWHFQMAHHGLWDYDLPAAPNLIDIRVNGQPVKAVAQVSKQGFVYVFDRVTGKPIWPIEEQPVRQSTVPEITFKWLARMLVQADGGRTDEGAILP